MTQIHATELTYLKEIMQTNVKTAHPDSTVKEVVEKMNRFNIGSIIIVQGEKPIGIITERDILQKVVEHCLDPNLCKAREIMTTPILTAGEDMSLDDAAKFMATRKIKKIPIVRSQTLVGIVTAIDLVEKNPTMVHILGRA
ncbi:MAG: cyclic nucleotide-binding/CBS domain-containing protein [Candidatus Bathyarchaeia archaeon]